MQKPATMVKSGGGTVWYLGQVPKDETSNADLRALFFVCLNQYYTLCGVIYPGCECSKIAFQGKFDQNKLFPSFESSHFVLILKNSRNNYVSRYSHTMKTEKIILKT